MSSPSSESRRSAILKTAASLAIGQAIFATESMANDEKESTATGKPGDFEFLAGEWKIRNSRLKTGGTPEWDEFEGEATCWTILGGIGSIEELRIPARNFSGMGLRLLDVEKRIWNDFWVNARSGVLSTPGQQGVFANGVGTFVADDSEDGKPIKVKGVWDRITSRSCRWSQAISRDGGSTWEENWSMDWIRVAPSETK